MLTVNRSSILLAKTTLMVSETHKLAPNKSAITPIVALNVGAHKGLCWQAPISAYTDKKDKIPISMPCEINCGTYQVVFACGSDIPPLRLTASPCQTSCTPQSVKAQML